MIAICDSLSMQCVQSDAIANWAHTAHRVASVMSSYASAAGTLVHDHGYLSTHYAVCSNSRDVYPFCKTW